MMNTNDPKNEAMKFGPVGSGAEFEVAIDPRNALTIPKWGIIWDGSLGEGSPAFSGSITFSHYSEVNINFYFRNNRAVGRDHAAVITNCDPAIFAPGGSFDGAKLNELFDGLATYAKGAAR